MSPRAEQATFDAPEGTPTPKEGGDDDVVVVDKDVPLLASCRHLLRSATSSPGAPVALRGTHVAQWHVASIARASSGPFGRTSAIRSPRP